MSQMELEEMSEALSALQRIADRIRQIEAQARDALFLGEDAQTHREKLQEKTMLLMELPETVEPFLDGMGGNAREEIETGAADFARRATQAWELSSVFYMAALLYPEDYRDGEKNNLELFVDRLRNRYATRCQPSST